MLRSVNYQNIVSLSLSGEKETGSAGMQPASDNLTDWNGHGGRKSPYYCFDHSKKLWLRKSSDKMIENEKITTSINPKKGQRILGQDNSVAENEK